MAGVGVTGDGVGVLRLQAGTLNEFLGSSLGSLGVPWNSLEFLGVPWVSLGSSFALRVIVIGFLSEGTGALYEFLGSFLSSSGVPWNSLELTVWVYYGYKRAL